MIAVDRRIPIPGAWVKRSSEPRYGKVLGARDGANGPELRVDWFPDRHKDWTPLASLENGFQIGMDVQDAPYSRVRRSLGEGHVIETRTLGGRGQVLVEFPTLGSRLWMPYENLKQVLGARHRFLIPRPQPAGSAERFRLRTLAHALELWNENTGSFANLDIDPLPHQVHLVHHILASGNLNWLIADDVGLGKTIEVGMLLAALRQRGGFGRILLVTPAGLTRQWQEELRQKFAMNDFLIYGHDFTVNDARHWKLYDHVIGSIDRLKADPHKAMLLAAEPWDLIIFDEAHRLSRRQWGMQFVASERYRLAADLRDHSDSLLLLTATPHQGVQPPFQALLELIRPELKAEIDSLDLNPEILAHMVIRNNKADVTDAEGRFVFKGKTTRAISVETSEAARVFDRSLADYLKRGYAAGQARGRTGIAIGFVMTVYRKLAASSAAAIHQALLRRCLRLQQQGDNALPTEELEDRRFAGEWEELHAGANDEFFAGELRALKELIEQASVLVGDDLKVRTFIEDLLASTLHANPDEKVLVFTEYRATQAHIADALRARFGEDKVALINGSQDVGERLQAIAEFEDQGQFLISTEAGGEGINLQRCCHIMVNFDLPWNPMRLVQRIGRLYRYGQTRRVVVFNVHAPQTLDAKIMELMYTRLMQVVADMAVVSGEFNEGLADDVLGQLSDVVEVEDVLETAIDSGISRTRERIDAALLRAKQAVSKQQELFDYVTGYDPNEARQGLVITDGHLQAFVAGMFGQLDIEVLARKHSGLVWDVRLPEDIYQELPNKRSRRRITFDRLWGGGRTDIEMMDLQAPLLQVLLRRAKRHDFGGLAASLTGLDGSAVLAAVLRWQNDQGRRMRQELTVVRINRNGRVDTDPKAFSHWLLASPAADGSLLPAREEAKSWMEAAEAALDQRLGQVSNQDLHPENRQWISGAWGND